VLPFHPTGDVYELHETFHESDPDISVPGRSLPNHDSLGLHGTLRLGKQFRNFMELYNGYYGMEQLWLERREAITIGIMQLLPPPQLQSTENQKLTYRTVRFP